jgi:hypothetical protein
LAKYYRQEGIEILIAGFENLVADPFPPKALQK